MPAPIQSVQDITASRLAGQQLRESQAREQAARAEAEAQRQRLYTVLMQLPAQVAVYHGPDHHYQFLNPNYQRLFPHRSFLGRPFREGTPEAERLGVVALFDQVYQTGEPYYGHALEGWFDFRGNGQPEQFFFDLSLHPLRNGAGEVDGVLDFSYDVTEQVLARRQVEQLNHELESRVQQRTHEAETARAEAEEQRNRLLRLFGQAPAQIDLFTGPDHVWTTVHPRTQQLLPRRPLQGLPRRQALPELPPEQQEPFDRVYRTGQPVQVVETVRRINRFDDGALHDVYFDITFQPTFDAAGRIEGVMSFALNVTERVRARQQTEALQADLLAAARQQVQEREAFHNVFEQPPALIALLRDPGHRFEYANPAYHAFFPGPQLVGRDIAEAAPELVAQGFGTLLDEVYRTGETYFGAEVPFTPPPPAGQPARPGYFTYQAYREAGAIAGISSFATDVTEQVRARQRVQELNAELQATNEELGTTNQQLTRTNVDLDNFIYTASHDLKAPITNIEGLLDTLRHELPELPPTGEVAYILDLMQESVERFQRTIEHLTAVSKLQKEHDPPTALVALAPVLEDVRQDLAPLLRQTGGRLHLRVQECPPLRLAEKNLRSVLYNLLNNALKYRHPDRTPEVHVRCHQEAGFTVLEVQDNGLGLDLAREKQVFAMFQRLHTHVDGSSGLGLYMVKRIMENAAGKITVHSQVGEGTTFSIYFPH